MTVKVESVKINKVAVITLSTLATVIGLLPLAFLLERLRMLPYFAGAAALLTLVMLLDEEAIATEKPALLEFLLGGFGAIAMPAFMSLIWMLIYGLLLGLLTLIFRLFNNPPEPAPIAFYISLVAGIFGIGGAIAFNGVNLVEQLYPNEVGIKSAFHEYATQGRGRMLMWTVFIVVVLGGGLAYLLTHGVGIWFYGALQFFLTVISFPVAMMEAETRRSKVQDVVSQLSSLLKQLEYEVTEFPRTYNTDYDLWLVNLDLCARRNGQHLLIQVKTPYETPEAVSWMAVSDFVNAVSVWAQYQQEELGEHEIEQRALLMILMDDVQEDETFTMGVKREGIGALHLAYRDLMEATHPMFDLDDDPTVQRLTQAIEAAMMSPQESQRT